MGAKAPEAGDMLNIRLNVALHRSSQIAYCSEFDYTFQLRRGTCTHVPPWLRLWRQLLMNGEVVRCGQEIFSTGDTFPCAALAE